MTLIGTLVNHMIVETSTTITNWGLVREKTDDDNKPKMLSKADKLKNMKTKSSVIVYLLILTLHDPPGTVVQ